MTQKDWVKEKLEKDGFITRNEALRVYLSRLSSIINILKNEEFYKFETEWIEVNTPWGSVGKDYKYIMISNGQDDA